MSDDDAEAMRGLLPYGDPDEITEVAAGWKALGLDGLIMSAPNGHIEGRVALLGETLAKVVG